MKIYFPSPTYAYSTLKHLYINEGCTKPHHGAILEFSSSQKTILLHLMKEIENLLAEYTSHIGRIEFVLLDSGVYWDFPFTWGRTMIMMTPKIFAKPRDMIRKILVHEWVHLDQRRFPAKYERFYKTLGFRKRHIDYGALNPLILRNPDADKYEWIWRNHDGGPTYAPVALLKSCKFHTVLLEITDIQRANYGDDIQVIVHPIEKITSYYERFGTKHQLYHPNEITAHIIADMLVDGVIYPQTGDVRSLL